MSTVVTNEALAIAAQAGDRDALLQLWNSVKRFAMWKARRFAGAEFDDLQQAGFLALVDAVKSFQPEKGEFLPGYRYALRSSFLVAKYGGRSEKNKRDPIHSAASLDEKAGDDEDGDAFADFVVDESAAEAFEQVEQAELARAVRSAIDTLSEQEKNVISCLYYRSMTKDAAAAALQISTTDVRKTEAAALRKLRHPSISRELKQYV